MEYKVKGPISIKNIEEELNRASRDGWSLFQILTELENPNCSRPTFPSMIQKDLVTNFFLVLQK